MNSKKKILSLLLALVLVFSLVACGKDNKPGTDSGTTGTGEKKTIGVLLYNGSDPYIGTVRQAMEDIAAKDDSIELDIQDAQENQATQNDQLDALVAKNVDALLINIVDFGAADQVIEKVKQAKVPAVFFNRDITKNLTTEDLDQMIFFGTDAPQAGVYQGEIAYENWKASGDKNKDGKLQYVTLHGGLDNAEAIARTDESAKVFTDNNVEIEQLDMNVANWEQNKAKDAMDAWISRFGDQIEVVFANNDGMALGALTALQAAGYNTVDADGNINPDKYIAVYGVDATADAVEKVKTGELTGTVRQSNTTMAEGTLALIKNKLAGKDWTDGTDFKIFEKDNVSVRMDHEKVTKDQN